MMRFRQIINEASMSDLATLLDEVRELEGAKVDIDPATGRVYFDFMLHGERGRMRMSLKRTGSYDEMLATFRKKVFAAARSENHGESPGSMKKAQQLITGTVRPNAIKILTNPQFFQVDRVSYGDMEIN